MQEYPEREDGETNDGKAEDDAAWTQRLSPDIALHAPINPPGNESADDEVNDHPVHPWRLPERLSLYNAFEGHSISNQLCIQPVPDFVTV